MRTQKYSPLPVHEPKLPRDERRKYQGSRRERLGKMLRHSIHLAAALMILLVVSIGALMVVSLLWSVFQPGKHVAALTLAELRNGTYASQTMSIQWTADGKNGEFLQMSAKNISIATWGDKSSIKYIAPREFTFDDESHNVFHVEVNKQRTHAIAFTDRVKNWRHSSFSRIWLLEIRSKAIKPIEKDVSIASWSPSGESFSYVLDHNVFVYDLASGSAKQVTFDGGADVFNGIPDWVYEEEVFSADSTLWWSETGRHLAYLRMNDSLVPTFPIPYFIDPKQKSGPVQAYPELTELKYPKPGYPIPSVELWTYTMGADEPVRVPIDTKLNEPIVSDVIWAGEQAVVKVMDRESDFLEVWVADPTSHKAVKTRSYSSEELGGSWFEIVHNSRAVGSEGYIDTIDVDGYNHLAFFSPVNSSTPIVLTRGPWEVDDSDITVNLETRHVYFQASKRSSIERTLYRASLNGSDQEITPVAFDGPGVYSAKFSGDASYALVGYTAPDAPLKQAVVSLPEDLGELKQWSLLNNSKLHDLLKERGLVPLDSKDAGSDKDSVQYGTVDIGNGVSVNYREIRPTKFNPKKKHPLLFYNYGGPGSQMVQKQLTLDFQRAFAEEHDAVVVTVDPRGTAKKGRAFRASVRGHLGEHEADDVIAVAKIWNQKKYIDEQTTAIWGWSYGGFLTLKTLERDTDLAFKFGVAVAPVTDWSLYDAVYTERYMHTPEHNAKGYAASAITDVETLAKHHRFLVMHGTGDDNVHLQNTLTLLDKLDLAGVENYDVHVFPDSDHSISFHNANTIVMDKVAGWLKRHQRFASSRHERHHSQGA